MKEMTIDDVIASMTFAPGDLVVKNDRSKDLGLVVAVDPNPDNATAWVVWSAGKRIVDLHGFHGLKHWEPQLAGEQATYAAIVRKERERYGFGP